MKQSSVICVDLNITLPCKCDSNITKTTVESGGCSVKVRLLFMTNSDPSLHVSNTHHNRLLQHTFTSELSHTGDEHGHPFKLNLSSSSLGTKIPGSRSQRGLLVCVRVRWLSCISSLSECALVHAACKTPQSRRNNSFLGSQQALTMMLLMGKKTKKKG